MTSLKYRYVSAAGLLAALFAFLSTTPAWAVEPTPELKAVIEAAKEEGALQLQWSAGVLGGSKNTRNLEQRLNAAYGTDLHLTFTPGGDMLAAGQEIALRQTANQPAPTDVYIAYSDGYSLIHKFDAFLQGPYEKFLPGRITDGVLEENGSVVKLATTLVGVSYNPTLVPYPPEKLADFLKPEWKGKIASTPYAAHFDVLAGNGMWGPQNALDYARALSQQVAGFMRCNEGERLASGEFIALVMNCGMANFSDMIAKGAPIKNVVMADFPILFYIYAAVPKNAVHPNAGKLLVTYLSTPAGQKLVYETDNVDLALYPGSHNAEIIERTKAESGATFVPIDIRWFLDHPESFTTWKQISDVLVKR